MLLLFLWIPPIYAGSKGEAFELFDSEKYEEAFPLMYQLARDGRPDAQGALARMYGNGWGTPKDEKEAYYWASRGITKNDPTSQYVIGFIHWRGLAGFEKSHQEAAKWLERSAAQGVGKVTAGRLFMFGEESIRDGEKAESYLKSSMTSGLNTIDAATAAYVLATAYLFGEGAVEESRPEGHKLLNELAKTDFNYFSYELESRLYATGTDRPRNSHKAILKALLGMQAEIEQHGAEEIITFGTWAGEYVMEDGVTYFVDLPDHLNVTWSRLLAGTTDEQGLYELKKSKFAKEVIDRSESTTLDDFFELVRTFLLIREREIGRVEPRDLINEGWAKFIGEQGMVDEPLAQILTEEGLRLAIRTRNKDLQSTARNNLGVILGGAANSSIRNQRLASVHLYDGRDSYWGADNMLWSHYMGSIKLSPQELDEMKDRFREETGSEHRTLTLPNPEPNSLSSYLSKVQFLERHYVEGDTEIASEISSTFETNASDDKDYQKALYWSRLSYDSERTERIERIIKGNFVRDIPNYTGAISRIFGVEANETRGGTLAGSKKETTEADPIRNPIVSKRAQALEVHALVIGNNEYRDDPLRNSINDSRAIATRLRGFGFFVTEANNLTRSAFRDVLIKFSERAKNADVSLFFYAGHGMQLGGINYLLPTDINFSVPQEVVTFDGISLNDLKSRYLPGATKLIFIDACRNNPFSSRTRGMQGRGLAPVNVGTGTLISFATRDGSVALDSVGGAHSPYTQGLLKHIDSKEDVEIMLRSVGDEVMRLTNNFQQPWKYGALSGEKVIIPMLTAPFKQ